MTQPFTNTDARKGKDRRKSDGSDYAGRERRVAERRHERPAALADGE